MGRRALDTEERSDLVHRGRNPAHLGVTGIVGYELARLSREAVGGPPGCLLLEMGRSSYERDRVCPLPHRAANGRSRSESDGQLRTFGMPPNGIRVPEWQVPL